MALVVSVRMSVPLAHGRFGSDVLPDSALVHFFADVDRPLRVLPLLLGDAGQRDLHHVPTRHRNMQMRFRLHRLQLRRVCVIFVRLVLLLLLFLFLW